jgi:hypothetical protein
MAPPPHPPTHPPISLLRAGTPPAASFKDMAVRTNKNMILSARSHDLGKLRSMKRRQSATVFICHSRVYFIIFMNGSKER